MSIFSKTKKYAALFLTGGLAYVAIEILFRGFSHASMFILGGICFILCGEVNEVLAWETPLTIQMGICCAAITILEFVFGVVLNIWLGLGIWDYSRMPFNLMGQICVPFTAAWYFLSAAAIILDDYIRYWLFGEEKPRYTLF